MPGDDQDIDQLLHQAQAGNVSALGQLLELNRNYLALLRVQIGRRLQGKVEAGDLVQETFLEAHRHFPRFRGKTEKEFVSWLRQIMAGNLAHQVRHYYSTQRRDVRLERRFAEDMDRSSRALEASLVAKQSSPSQRASRREQAVLLTDALQRLPEHYREVLVLRHMEELSFPEVAQRMDRSVDSVEKLWIRALDRLRRSLKGTT